jgi:hypothetical protein
MQSSDT